MRVLSVTKHVGDDIYLGLALSIGKSKKVVFSGFKR